MLTYEYFLATFCFVTDKNEPCIKKLLIHYNFCGCSDFDELVMDDDEKEKE